MTSTSARPASAAVDKDSAGERRYPRFSDGEFRRRYAGLRAKMDAAGVDVVVAYGHGLASGPVQYLTNWPVTVEAYAVFGGDDDLSLYVEYYNHVPLARRVSVAARTDWIGPDPVATLTSELARRKATRGRIGLAGPMPAWRFDDLRAELRGAALVRFDRALTKLRLVKSAEELEWMRRGAQCVDLALEELEREARPGVSEHDLAAIVQRTYPRRGGRSVIHFLAATPMSAPDICVPTQYPSGRVLQRGDVLLTEIGVNWWGYGGQSLRPYAIGTPPTREFERLYAIARAAFDAVAGALRTGARPEEVIAAAGMIEDSGHTICDDLVHGIGGGYLPPVLRTRGTAAEPPDADFRYPADSTWVIQPNVVRRDTGAGIQLGDMVRVTDSGAERMQCRPLTFSVCGR